MADVSDVYVQAAAQWPTITGVTLERFATFVHERGPGADLAFAADLFLACGCCAGSDCAFAAFDAGPLRRASAAIRTIVVQDFVRDEVLQRARIKLLTGRPPLIARYEGSGPLFAWARSALVRIALDVGRELGRSAAPEEAAARQDAERSPEEALDGARAGIHITVALTAALQSLSEDDRRLLREHVVDGCSVDELAPRLQVHRSTVARRLALLRKRVRRGTERIARDRFGMTSGELRQSYRAYERLVEVPWPALLEEATLGV